MYPEEVVADLERRLNVLTEEFTNFCRVVVEANDFEEVQEAVSDALETLENLEEVKFEPDFDLERRIQDDAA